MISIPSLKSFLFITLKFEGVKRSTEVDSVREVARIKSPGPSAYFVNFRSGHKYRVQIQADKELPLLNDVLKAPPSRPFFVYGPLRPPQELAVRWESEDQLSVTWQPSEGATSYELVFMSDGDDDDDDDTSEPIRVVDARLGWTGLPSLDRPKRVKVRSLGVHSLVSERFAEAEIPNLLSPPEGVAAAWPNSTNLAINWEPAVHAEKYEVRFHRGETTYSLEVSGTRWTGSLGSPAPVAVSICSIARNDIRSEYSPELAIPDSRVNQVTLTVNNFPTLYYRGVDRADNDEIANGLDAMVVERDQGGPPALEERASSFGNTSDGDVDDVLNHLEVDERASSHSPTARTTPEVDAMNELPYRNGHNYGRMMSIPLPALYDPASDSSDDEVSGDEDSDLDVRYKTNVLGDDFDADIHLEGLEETQPLSGGRERRSVSECTATKQSYLTDLFLQNFDGLEYDELNECTFSGLHLSVGDLFDFKRQRNGSTQSANAKQTKFLGRVLGIRKLKSSGQVSLLILHWVYFDQWFNAPKPSGTWSEKVEDAVVLVFDSESAMGTLEDAQVIDEANLSWCARARYQDVTYKNAFDASADPRESFVCRFAASVSFAFTVVTLAPHLSGKQFRKTSEPRNQSLPEALAVADFFCGAGGFSLGFKQAGFDIKHGVDRDVEVLNTFSVCSFFSRRYNDV